MQDTDLERKLEQVAALMGLAYGTLMIVVGYRDEHPLEVYAQHQIRLGSNSRPAPDAATADNPVVRQLAQEVVDDYNPDHLPTTITAPIHQGQIARDRHGTKTVEVCHVSVGQARKPGSPMLR